MIASTHTVESPCKEHLDRFFARYPDAALQSRAAKAVRILTADDQPFAGKPEGWAAGIIYALANRDRQACGMPGLLNSEFAEFFGVSMGTVRKRAASVAERIII
jgi:Domain of unknown function (DUF6398)